VAGATNRLTVTLVSATALAVDAVVTISGLKGAVATANDDMPLVQVGTNTGYTMFKDNGAGTVQIAATATNF
jgi:preprotein translocase subunit YajC